MKAHNEANYPGQQKEHILHRPVFVAGVLRFYVFH
jgi:hypothetical protein